jgi:hypothetical protein
VLINLSPDETRPFCAHHASERQRLTERQSFVFSVISIVGLALGAVLLAAVSGPTQSS